MWRVYMEKYMRANYMGEVCEGESILYRGIMFMEEVCRGQTIWRRHVGEGKLYGEGM